MQHSWGTGASVGRRLARATREVASRRAGPALVAAFVASIAVAGAGAGPVGATTVVQTWQTRIGVANAPTDTATIQAFDTGKGVVRIRAARLRASASYSVTFYRGRCGWMATRLFALPSITTTSTGALSRSLAISASQIKAVRSNWNNGSGVAFQLARGSSKRCGDLGALAALGKAVRLENEQTHTVVRAEAWSGDGRWEPGEGSTYVTLYVRIKANANTHFNSLDYSLIDGRGTEWTGMVFGDREPEIGYGDLVAGQTVEGWLMLEAPTDQLGRLTLAYRMNTSLHGPTLYVPIGQLAPPAPPTELRAAVQAGKVAVIGSGQGLQRLQVTLTSQDTQTIRLAIEPGTLFHPGLAATQTMVAIESQVITLGAAETKTVGLDVACAAMHLDQPGSSDQFAMDAAPASSALTSLLAVPEFGSETFRVKQFAIWTITDNPPRADYVGLGSFGFGTGPSDTEVSTIRQLFVKAGLDPSAYLGLA